MEEETELPPTEDDLIGKNGAYTQSIAILHHGLNSMSRKLAEIKVVGGDAVEAVGEFPFFVVDRREGSKETGDEPDDNDWPLKVNFVTASTISFTPAQVEAFSGDGTSLPTVADILVTPLVDGTPIDSDPTPTLPFLTDGGIICLKHTYTWKGDFGPANPGYVATELVEVVQFPLIGPIDPPVRQISTPYGLTEVAGNIAYKMISAYSGEREIITDSIYQDPTTGQFTPRSVKQTYHPVTYFGP